MTEQILHGILDKNGNLLTTPIEELQTVGVPYFYNSNAQVDLGVEGLPYWNKRNKYYNAFTSLKYTENALRVENMVPIRLRY